MTKKILAAVLPLALAFACGGDAKKPDAKSAPKADGPKALDLAKLGLKMDAPAGAEVSDGIGGGVMVQGPGLVVNVDAASDSRPKTIDDAKKEVEMYNPKNIKTETLGDGWALTFENEGGAGANYWVNVRRDIGGKAYWCETTASQPEQQTNALAACKSLKK